jgi:hypothetical protein
MYLRSFVSSSDLQLLMKLLAAVSVFGFSGSGGRKTSLASKSEKLVLQ